ncbi:MAG: HU family DNA-binding protein [Planctomycetota bacterium]|jgi:nucleoid DNA-binding protein
MTKNDIVVAIAKETGQSYKDVRRVVQRTFDSIIEALASEGKIELRNFGVFKVRKRRARKARNPRTGEPVHVAAYNTVVFKPGLTMQEKIR